VVKGREKRFNQCGHVRKNKGVLGIDMSFKFKYRKNWQEVRKIKQYWTKCGLFDYYLSFGSATWPEEVLLFFAGQSSCHEMIAPAWGWFCHGAIFL
jgi:hypothetical protein